MSTIGDAVLLELAAWAGVNLLAVERALAVDGGALLPTLVELEVPDDFGVDMSFLIHCSMPDN